MDYNYGKNGEFIGLDVKAMRTQSIEESYTHLENSIKIVKMLESKVKRFDKNVIKQYQESRNYEGLEMYIMELLLGEK
jgi:xylose isomerase